MMIVQSQDQTFFQPKNKTSKNQIQKPHQFFFPENQFIEKRFTSLSQAKAFVCSQGAEVQNRNLWSIRMLKARYLYCKCKYCEAFLSFKAEGSDVYLTKYNNYHIHNKKSMKKRQQQRILEYLRSLPGNVSEKDLRFSITNKFTISQRRYYYITNKYMKSKSFPELFEYFNEMQLDVQYDWGQQSVFPQILLFNSKQMKQMDYKYGQVVCFDISYNMIKERSSTNRQWGVAIFSGLDSNLRLIVFAIALISKQTTTSIKKLFSAYLNLCHKQPSIIISDQQLTVVAALEQLKSESKFHGYHLLDIFHILKNIKKRIDKQQFSYYLSLIKARNQQQYENILNKAIQYCKPAFLQHFIERSSRFSFSMLPDEFVGFSSCNSRSEKLNDILKGFIPYQICFYSFFVKIMKFVNHIYENHSKSPQMETKKYENLFNDFGILEVRTLIEKRIFEKFMQNYIKGLRLSVQQIIEGQQYICRSKNQKWIVKKGQQTFTCLCRVKEKSGLPCQHILKVLWVIGDYKYGNYINKRWIRKDQKPKQLRGRPKLSRKNMIR